MVNEYVLIKKKRSYKKTIGICFLVILILGILFMIFYLGMIIGGFNSGTGNIVLENPIKDLIEDYGLEDKGIDRAKIIEQAEFDFNQDYINYVLIALGAYKLHNPPLSKEIPRIRFVLIDSDGTKEIYNSEIINNKVKTYIGDVEEADLIVTTNKKEVINAMLSKDIRIFMKNSVRLGRTEIDMKANKIILISKGYIQMYEEVTGERFI